MIMEAYNPNICPNPEDWLAIDEKARIDLVRESLKKYEDDLDNDAAELHSLIHVIVENQLALGVELIPETIDKLMRQGLDRHGAIHAIGAIISGFIMELKEGASVEFSPKQYRIKLEKITAKRWRKGQW